MVIVEDKKSTHKVEVVPVVMEAHANADSLSVVNVFGGYSCVVRTEDWRGVSRAAYLPPDSVADVTRPEFSFLADQAKPDGKVRIKAKKLRGVVSFGLLVPVADDVPLGTDLSDDLGVTHYEPPIKGEGGSGSFMGGGEAASGPSIYAPKYDLDAFRRYHELFEPREPVVATEKLDGSLARYVCVDGVMHCGSKNEWKREFADTSHITVDYLLGRGVDPDKAEETVAKLRAKPQKRNMWWEVLSRTPALESFCRANPGVVVYGEIAGTTNCVKYCGENHFAAFDILRDGRWLDFDVARELGCDLPWVPTLAYNYPYDFGTICELAEGGTTWDKATSKVIREGCVVKPIRERSDERIGRVCLKVVSSTFLERYR